MKRRLGMRVCSPRTYGEGMWVREEASAPEFLWSANPIKGIIYRYFLNDFNKMLFNRYERWIEL